jgi:hypothetical protein
MDVPGHRTLWPPTRAGTAVQIRNIDGRQATDGDGAAELLGRSRQTITLLASTKKRVKVGWPSWVRRVDGRDWYAIEDLEHFRDTYLPRVAQASQAKVHHVALDGDPEELITAVEFRELIKAEYGTWAKYVDQSKPAWQRGEDGYLPRPDEEEPYRRGVTRKWKRHRVQTWINARTGKHLSPGRPEAGRTPISQPTAGETTVPGDRAAKPAGRNSKPRRSPDA